MKKLLSSAVCCLALLAGAAGLFFGTLLYT